MDTKKLIQIIVFTMGLFIFISLSIVSVGMDWTTNNDFCKDCHRDESGLYNKPGTSLDYLHNTNDVKCIDCHRNTGRSKVSNPSNDLKTILIFDVLGTHPVIEGSIANAADTVGGNNAYGSAINIDRYCLGCHPDYVQRVKDKLISPHEQNTDCTNCHIGHSRTEDSEVCSECHSRPYNTLQREGGKHSKKECGFCHPRHGYIPACQTCHNLFHGEAKELIQCMNCHIDAHSPRNVKLDVYNDAGNGTEADSSGDLIICAKCHAGPQKTFVTTPTKHAKIACILCHESHGDKPQCVNCHESHNESINADDCMNCHTNPHDPTRVEYPATTTNEFCANCHDMVLQVLADSDTKHSELRCAQCHPVHGQIPTCVECHRIPHGPAVTDCGISCHLSAHDVWKVK